LGPKSWEGESLTDDRYNCPNWNPERKRQTKKKEGKIPGNRKTGGKGKKKHKQDQGLSKKQSYSKVSNHKKK